MANYQMVNINGQTDASQAQINGWFVVNGEGERVLASAAVGGGNVSSPWFWRGSSAGETYTREECPIQNQEFFTNPRQVPLAPSLLVTASKVPHSPRALRTPHLSSKA